MTLGLALGSWGFLLGVWGVPLVWLGLDFLLLGVAHFRSDHVVFGKRPDGTIPLWSWLVFGPLLAFTVITWHLARLLSREPCVNRVSDQLVVGRRLLPSEIPNDFSNYIDLTSEFQEPKIARMAPGYKAFPVLDGSAPRPEALRVAVASLRPGPTFVHCAQGHGRTGMFALAVLLATGVVSEIQEGLVLLGSARPAIRLSPAQVKCVEAAQLRATNQADRADV
jgi:protein-tyrosine phosphatase